MGDEIPFLALVAPDISIMAPVTNSSAEYYPLHQIYQDETGPSAEYIPITYHYSPAYDNLYMSSWVMSLFAKILFIVFMLTGTVALSALVYRLIFGFPDDPDRELPRWFVERRAMQKRRKGQDVPPMKHSDLTVADLSPTLRGRADYDSQTLHAAP